MENPTVTSSKPTLKSLGRRRVPSVAVPTRAGATTERELRRGSSHMVSLAGRSAGSA